MQRAPSCSSARPEPNSSPISLSLSARSLPCRARQPSATEDAKAAVRLPRVGTSVAGMQQYLCRRHIWAYARPREARAACAGPGGLVDQARPKRQFGKQTCNPAGRRGDASRRSRRACAHLSARPREPLRHRGLGGVVSHTAPTVRLPSKVYYRPKFITIMRKQARSFAVDSDDVRAHACRRAC